MGERENRSMCKTYTFRGRWRPGVISASIAPASSSLSSLSTVSSHIDVWVSRLLAQPFLGTALDIPLENPCCRWTQFLLLCVTSGSTQKLLHPRGHFRLSYTKQLLSILRLQHIFLTLNSHLTYRFHGDSLRRLKLYPFPSTRTHKHTHVRTHTCTT